MNSNISKTCSSINLQIFHLITVSAKGVFSILVVEQNFARKNKNQVQVQLTLLLNEHEINLKRCFACVFSVVQQNYTRKEELQ
ncbi:MAG: hypothetical protein ACRCVE_11665 [Plesiomonas sp.]